MSSIDELHLKVVFGSTQPQVLRYPHIVIRQSHELVDSIIRGINEPIGVFGFPPYPDMVDPEASWPETFAGWRGEENQRMAVEVGSHGVLPAFSMIIPLSTSVEVLRALYQSIEKKPYEEFNYYDGMAQLGSWIGILEWAYVPLEYEAAYGLFIASRSNASLIDIVKHSYISAGGSVMFDITNNWGSFQWNGPFYIEVDDGRAG